MKIRTSKANNETQQNILVECEKCGGLCKDIYAGESDSVEFMRAHVDTPLLKCSECHHEFKPF